MRSTVALACTAALAAALLSGCDDGKSGAPMFGAPTTTSAGGGINATRPTDPNSNVSTPPSSASGVAALAGDWQEETSSSSPITAHVESDGKLTLTRRGQTLKGQMVSLTDTHFRILIISSGSSTPPSLTADLGSDGQTLTVTSPDESGSSTFKKIG